MPSYSSLAISVAETVYEVLIGLFFICKSAGHFDCPTTQTARVTSRNSGEVTAVLAGFISVELDKEVETNCTLLDILLHMTCRSVGPIM